MFTAHFGVIKGRAEAALLALSKEDGYKLFKPYSLRPGGVDPSKHPEIKEFIPKKSGLAKKGEEWLIPPIRAVYPVSLSTMYPRSSQKDREDCCGSWGFRLLLILHPYLQC
jgi:hypothetical protein